MASIEPHLLTFTPFCNPFSLTVGSALTGLKKLLTSNGCKYGKRDGIRVLRLGCNETVASICVSSSAALLAHFDGSQLHVVSGPMGEPHGKN